MDTFQLKQTGHGNANIPERSGRTLGLYTADVSDFVIGYLVGRELEPEEVKKGRGDIKNIEMSKDEAFLYVHITINNNFEVRPGKVAHSSV